MVNRPAAVRGVAAAFLALSTIAVLLRCYVRLRIVKAFGWDDGIMILAMLFYIMYCGSMFGGGIWGTGRHLADLIPEHASIAMEYWFLAEVAYTISSILAKISVCIFLLRVMLFPCHRATLYTVTTLVVTTGLVFFILLVAQCSPVSFFWTRMGGDTSGRCRYIDPIAIMFYIFSAASALFDLTVGLLPIMLVRKLQMNIQTKAAVVGLLGMACVASVAVIVRMPFVGTIRDPDFLSGSLATTRPLFRIFRSRSSPPSPSPYPPFDFDYYNYNYNGNDNDNGTSPPSTSKSRSKHTRNRSSKSSRSGGLHALATFDSGLGVGRTSLASTRTTCTRSEDAPGANLGLGLGPGFGLEPDNFDHRSISGRSTKTNKPSDDFYGPYIGMMTMRATVEGGRGDEFGSAAPYPGAGQEGVLNADGRRGEGAVGLGTSGLASPHLAAARSGRSGSTSRIGVHRTFEVSSETTEGEGAKE
ncbi:hypothetical protein BJX68DRAFT_274002 [Aspergillus pseudodeflectus]|uniref:Rhodopsin domain-containing protein n=1 Tax=Aspergillus pseudodeflectus TaxID=176178 RepID=A0ABR4LBT8_9EURO